MLIPNYIRIRRVVTIKFFHPANIYLFKVNNRKTRKKCKICSKLTIKTPKRPIADFEQVNASWACTIYQAMAVGALKQ